MGSAKMLTMVRSALGERFWYETTGDESLCVRRVVDRITTLEAGKREDAQLIEQLADECATAVGEKATLEAENAKLGEGHARYKALEQLGRWSVVSGQYGFSHCLSYDDEGAITGEHDSLAELADFLIAYAIARGEDPTPPADADGEEKPDGA